MVVFEDLGGAVAAFFDEASHFAVDGLFRLARETVIVGGELDGAEGW